MDVIDDWKRRKLIYKEKEYALKDLVSIVWDNFLSLRAEIIRLFKEYDNNPSDELKKTIINLCNVGIEQASDNYYLVHFLIINPITQYKYQDLCNKIKAEFESIVSQLSKSNKNNK